MQIKNVAPSDLTVYLHTNNPELSPERGKGIEKTTDANRLGVFKSCIFLYLFHGHNGHNKGSEVKICAQMPK